MAKTETLVPLEEVANWLGAVPGAIRDLAATEGIEVVTDWAGRMCLTEPEARALCDRVQRSRRESAEAHQAYQVYLEGWAHRQHDAGEEVFQRFCEEALEAQRAQTPGEGYAYLGQSALAVPVGGQTYSEANSLAAEAREKFARREPRLSFEAFEKKWRKRR